MNKYPNEEVESKIKEVEEFAKANKLNSIYVYSENEDWDGETVYTSSDYYINDIAYELENLISLDTNIFIIYVNNIKFISRNA